MVFAMLAAFVGGLVAYRLRQPAIFGYLVAGLAINTFAPHSLAESHALQVLGEIGVAFLMFAHGAEFSRGELHRLARLSAAGGYPADPHHDCHRDGPGAHRWACRSSRESF